MKTYGGVDVQIHVSFTSALDGDQWSVSRPSLFTPGIHWIGNWVGPTTGVNNAKRRKIFPLPGLKLRLLGRPVCSRSLYRLSCPTHLLFIRDTFKWRAGLEIKPMFPCMSGMILKKVFFFCQKKSYKKRKTLIATEYSWFVTPRNKL
jgi:hypothetical protein